MKRYEILEKIRQTGVVAVIRADTSEKGAKIVEAVETGGIQAIEVGSEHGHCL